MAKKKQPLQNTPSAGALLRSYRDRIIRLEEEKKGLAEDVKDIYSEAKGNGFDPKALRKIVSDSMKTQEQLAAQRETEDITDVYRAALGMLDGEPLSDAARRRFEQAGQRPGEDDEADGPPRLPSHPHDHDDDRHGGGEIEMPEPSAPEHTADQARDRGRADHAAGVKVLGNPYRAGLPQRAAWDEGWCDAAGGNGMDISDAFKRRPKEEQDSNTAKER